MGGLIAYPQRMISHFILAVFLFGENQLRLIEKHLLSLKASSSLLFFASSPVSSVPVESCNLFPVNHLCILPA
ncbi:MAG: hypothetical protein ACJATP_001188 [Candidatus Azotimanducaceae bacterium]|jgi:hypothetical protein